MMIFGVCYYLLVGLIVAPVLVACETCGLSADETMRVLWRVLTVRIAP